MENRGDDDKLAEEVIDDDEMDQYSELPTLASSSHFDSPYHAMIRWYFEFRMPASLPLRHVILSLRDALAHTY